MPRDAFRFEDTNRNVSPEMRLKSFGTFKKWAPGQKCSLEDLDRILYCAEETGGHSRQVVADQFRN